jgi:hypothetical protein
MTEEQFEQAMNTYQLDMEYTDYIMDRANVGNGEILIRLMERGDFYEGFKEKMVTEFEPRREWVGLNDDEIDYLIHLAYTGDEEFVQTIEAKLKEKNLPCIKPEWIGLTEKEHTEIAIECGCLSADWVFYGATVERKLKEKNNL